MTFIQTLKSGFTAFKRDQRGVAAIVGAIVLPALMGAVGLGVDTTRYYRAKQIIVEAADAAALAAASVDNQNREEVAKRFFLANIPTEYKGIVELKNFKFVDKNKNTGGPITVDYEINATMETTFIRVVGVDTIALNHIGTAIRDIHNIEVVMALPQGGTMCSTKVRSENTGDIVQGDTVLSLIPDPSCRHFNVMKEGVTSFINLMMSNQSVARFKLGIVPYNYKVKMPNLNNIPPHFPQNENELDRNFYVNFRADEEVAPILPLTSQKGAMLAKLSEMVQNEGGSGWSRSNVATLGAGLMLDPRYSSYFPNIEKVEAFGNKSVEKIVILLTDGSNIGCCFTNHRPGNFQNQYVYFFKPDNEQQLDYCRLLKEQNVRIFSILFDVSEKDPGGKEINNVFARCASGTYAEAGVSENNDDAKIKCRHKQSCYNVSKKEDLIAAYKDIAQNFYMTKTSR